MALQRKPVGENTVSQDLSGLGSGRDNFRVTVSRQESEPGYTLESKWRPPLEIDDKFRPYVKTFPATELPPYGEPISPQEMQEGRVYFALQFLDRDGLVPHLYPLIFLGNDLDGDSKSLRFFQYFDSYIAGVRYGRHREEDSACFEAYGQEEGKHIFDFESALKVLMRCALTRRDVADIDQRIRRLSDEAQS